MDDEDVTEQLKSLADCAIRGVVKRMKDQIAEVFGGAADAAAGDDLRDRMQRERDIMQRERDSMQRELEKVKAQLAEGAVPPYLTAY